MKQDMQTLLMVLNVDDFEPGRYARTRLLQQAGYKVQEAATGTDALSMIGDHRPALVLLDVNLPDISGIEVCRRIKCDPELSSTLVLQISAQSISSRDWAHALETGADAYLTEPVDPPVLLATVKALLRISSAEQQLQQANAELRRSNEDLARFAYVASHDLQEPLRTITTYSQLLVRRFGKQQDEDVARYAQFIVDGTTRMSDLIRDLLLYSQVGARYDFAPVDLDEVLQTTLSDLRVMIHEAGAHVTSASLPALTADRDQMIHLFQNLISNSIKYRSAEPPQVRIGVQAKSRGIWQFSFRDNGIGFAPRYAEQIFEAFRRLDRTRSPGSGVGLAIARRVVENHGGTIWAESEAGSGATFHFTLVDQSR